MFTPGQQNTGQNRMLRKANKTSKNVANFKYLGTTPTQNIHN